MKRVLIITYYWPPSGGSGVQRWLKFVKYLPQFAWQPVVYTPENPEISVLDESLLKDIPTETEILKTSIWEPYAAYQKFLGKKKNSTATIYNLKDNKSFSSKIANFIRSNFFIPDARCFWVRPSYRFLYKYLKSNPVDAIITTGPPHSLHLIALRLKKKFNIPWIADFRDPWTNIDYFEDLKLSALARRKHFRLEKTVLTEADVVLTIGETMKNEFIQLGAQNVSLIYNGFDEDDIAQDTNNPKNDKFVMCHIGVLGVNRNPIIFWDTLRQLFSENIEMAENIRIKLIGKVDDLVKQMIAERGLAKNVDYIDYLPHNEVVKQQKASDVLLLFINHTKNAKGIITGKFFEYMAAQRPILAIGPLDGDAAHILKAANAGRISDFSDSKQLLNNIAYYYELFKSNSNNIEAEQINKFSRKSLTLELVELLNGFKI